MAVRTAALALGHSHGYGGHNGRQNRADPPPNPGRVPHACPAGQGGNPGPQFGGTSPPVPLNTHAQAPVTGSTTQKQVAVCVSPQTVNSGKQPPGDPVTKQEIVCCAGVTVFGNGAGSGSPPLE